MPFALHEIDTLVNDTESYPFVPADRHNQIVGGLLQRIQELESWQAPDRYVSFWRGAKVFMASWAIVLIVFLFFN